jgi:hypothetical protein
MSERDPALRALWLMTLVRLVGLALAILGLWLATTLSLGPESRWLGLAAMLAGAAIVILAPRLFRR